MSQHFYTGVAFEGFGCAAGGVFGEQAGAVGDDEDVRWGVVGKEAGKGFLDGAGVCWFVLFWW